MRTIIVGDIHGCLEEFKTLLNQISLSSKDHLIMLGDLVDRGPDSVGVVKLGFSLSQKYKVSLIRGNHEHKHIITMCSDHQFSNHEEIQKTQQSLSEPEREWLFSGSLFYRDKTKGILCVHGGVPKFMNKLPWPQYEDNRGQSLLHAKQMMFLKKEGSSYWAEYYKGQFGQVFFGHQVFKSPQKFSHALGLDTGCVFGGSLSAAILSSDNTEIVSVPAEDRYYINHSKNRYYENLQLND